MLDVVVDLPVDNINYLRFLQVECENFFFFIHALFILYLPVDLENGGRGLATLNQIAGLALNQNFFLLIIDPHQPLFGEDNNSWLLGFVCAV